MRLTLRSHHLGYVAAVTIMMGGQQPGVDERSAATFLRELQRGVARDDRTFVAALIRYPLTVQAGGLRIPMADTATLLQSDDFAFSPAPEGADRSGGDSGSGTLGSHDLCHGHGWLDHDRT